MEMIPPPPYAPSAPAIFDDIQMNEIKDIVKDVLRESGVTREDTAETAQEKAAEAGNGEKLEAVLMATDSNGEVREKDMSDECKEMLRNLEKSMKMWMHLSPEMTPHFERIPRHVMRLHGMGGRSFGDMYRAHVPGIMGWDEKPVRIFMVK